MSFHDKGFWMTKGNAHITDNASLFDNSSRVDTKRSHQWFTDATETELFPHKRQAIESPNSKSISTIPPSHLSWDNVSTFHSSPNQFIDRLLGSPVNMDKKTVHESSVGLSMSYTIEDPENSVNYGAIRKVKVNKDTDNNRENENNFITVGHNYGNEDGNVTLMGHSYSGFDPGLRSNGTSSEKDTENPISIGHSFDKGDANSISFGGFADEPEIDPLTRPINGYYVKPMNNYELTFDHSTVKSLQSSANTIGGANASQGVKLKTKSGKKEAPNSFPSNVRSLMATGILDGVPVKYVSLSREELRGIIKGSGCLCGCQLCNHSKALNAYEFERHAGCKTKHPNNHIYFESGKTIYQIVQELRSTPESLLFDAIQTVTGSPINQKAFRSWKESFQAATRELERIYGKDELNI